MTLIEKNWAKRYFGVEEQPDIVLESFETNDWLQAMAAYALWCRHKNFKPHNAVR